MLERLISCSASQFSLPHLLRFPCWMLVYQRSVGRLQSGWGLITVLPTQKLCQQICETEKETQIIQRPQKAAHKRFLFVIRHHSWSRTAWRQRRELLYIYCSVLWWWRGKHRPTPLHACFQTSAVSLISVIFRPFVCICCTHSCKTADFSHAAMHAALTHT